MKKFCKKITVYILALILLLTIFASLFIGRYPLDIPTVLKVLMCGINKDNYSNQIFVTVIWDIRLPRIIMGGMVGASLAVSGTALQGLFKNPLVDTGILGVSSGAGFGAVLGIILFDNIYLTLLFAFLFGIGAVLLSIFVGRIKNSDPTVMLVLGGVIVSSLFSSLISLGKYMADPYDQLPEIVFWLMGSLANANFEDLIISIIPMSIGIIGLLLIRWQINLLSVGEKNAKVLGVNTKLVRGLTIIFTTMATAGAVCISGVIGWIGLIIPHIGRLIVGSDNRILLPISVFLGAIYLILIDNLARTLTGGEIPISILTSFIGAPFYIYILKKAKGKSW